MSADASRCRHTWAHVFKLIPGTFYTSFAQRLQGAMDLYVLFDLALPSDMWVVSNADWLPFQPAQDFLAKQAPPPPPPKKPPEFARLPHVGDMALAEHPLLIDLMDKRERRAATRHADHHNALDNDLVAQAANAASSSTDRPVEDVATGWEEDDVFEVLRQRRDAWAAGHAAPGEVHFTSSLRDGMRAASRTGSVADSIRAQASSTTAQEFCRLHGLAHSGTFSLRLYGEESFALLASLWVARMTPPPSAEGSGWEEAEEERSRAGRQLR